LKQTTLQARYQQTLDFMYAQLPMYHRVGAAAFKKDLTNTLALCEHLGNPHQKFPSIHIAGTNGKGSVSHFLSGICQAAGLKVGLYVSPHYLDFRERIRVNGIYIPKQKVIDFVAQNKDVITAIQPSFFEMCVAMAFDHFAREKVDIAIVEVGLGGRLDSTNIITPLLSVITNISFDHMDMLGNTLPLIAGEKAGIIKKGIPVVVGETHPETAPVFLNKAEQEFAAIIFADQHFETIAVAETLGNSVFHVRKNGKPYMPDFEAEIAGPYQSKNVSTALQAVDILWQLPDFQLILKNKNANAALGEYIAKAFCKLRALTKFQGRWQLISQNPMVLCDSAHNEAGLNEVFQKLEIYPALAKAKLHIVTGFVNDKDLSKALVCFPTSATYYFAKANIPRGLDKDLLKTQAAEFGLHGRAYASVRRALGAAKRAANGDDVVLVVGSIFVVAEVL
jgi:dihydrofolate synthase / folylpolyglutamate synthase